VVLKEWGFTCKCPLCASRPSEIALSDARRERLNAIKDTLVASYATPSSAKENSLDERAVGPLVDEMFLLAEKEELWPKLVVFYEVAARAYLAVGGFASARRYAVLAEGAWARFLGEEHKFVKEMEDLWKDIRLAVAVAEGKEV